MHFNWFNWPLGCSLCVIGAKCQETCATRTAPSSCQARTVTNHPGSWGSGLARLANCVIVERKLTLLASGFAGGCWWRRPGFLWSRVCRSGRLQKRKLCLAPGCSCCCRGSLRAARCCRWLRCGCASKCSDCPGQRDHPSELSPGSNRSNYPSGRRRVCCVLGCSRNLSNSLIAR